MPYITNSDNGTPYKILSCDKNGVKYERFVRNFDSASKLNYKLGEILDLVGYLDCKAGTDESCYKGRGFDNYNIIKAKIIAIEKLED